MKGLRLGIAVLLTALLVATGIFVSGVVQASHNFSDVPTTAFYHNAVEWVFNRGITAGCAAGLYCPNDAVTRGTMAVFLRALGIALTPTALTGGDFAGAVDPDVSPVVCQTGNYTPTFPQRAQYQNFLSLNAAGAMSIFNVPVRSSDSGATWTIVSPPGVAFPTGGAASAQWFSTAAFATFNMTPGTTYRFGVRASRRSGTADATDFECSVVVEIVNRNPTTSPLAPEPPPRQIP